MVSQKYLTPKQVAERYGCNRSKVSYLIKTGQLAAIDISLDPGGKPRLRITEEALAAFEASRAVQPASPPAPRPRRRPVQGVKYF